MSLRQRYNRFCILFLIVCVLPVASAAQISRVDGVPRLAIRDPLISDRDDDWSFQQIYALVVDGRGRIYAWDSEDYKIRIFDSSGKAVRLLGSKGQGPGELSQLGHLTVSNDTLWVSEIISNRVTAFASNSEGYRTVTVVPKSGGNVVAKLSNGFLVNVTSTDLGGSTRSEVIDRTGDVRAVVVTSRTKTKVLTYDVVQENVKSGPIVGRQVLLQPYVMQGGLHTFPDGNGFISANLAELIGNTIVLKSIAGDGSQIWETRTRFQPISFTEADFQKAVEKLIAPTVVKGMRIVGNRKMIIDSLVRPKFWPAFTSVVLGIDKSIWLKAGSQDADASIFWQFSSKGVFERRVRIPADVRVMAASQSHLWGTRRDADGNPTIERYVIK